MVSESDCHPEDRSSIPGQDTVVSTANQANMGTRWLKVRENVSLNESVVALYCSSTHNMNEISGII